MIQHDDGLKTLVCDMMRLAWTDATSEVGEPPPSEDSPRRWLRIAWNLKAHAVAWLASKDATKWFEACGIDQEIALSQPAWGQAARDVLRHRTEYEIPEELCELIRESRWRIQRRAA